MEYSKFKYEKRKVSAILQNFVILFILISSVFVTLWYFLDKNSIKEMTEINNQLLLRNLSFTHLNITKPDSFKEKIKYIKLPNELEIIIVESDDKKLTKNSASIIINSNLDNAPETIGIDTLCKNILLHGSEKYPNDNIFNDLITRNEGHFNSLYNKDSTSFIYDIRRERFLESLDVFFSYFINPLFREDIIEKNLRRISSEFKKNFEDTEKYFDNLLAIHTNTQILSDLNFLLANKDLSSLRNEVIQYFNKHYVGRNIKVMIYTNYEVENIERLILNNLVKVKKSEDNLPFKPFSKVYSQHKLEDIPKIIFYKTDLKILKIYYILTYIKKELGIYLKTYLRFIFSIEYKDSLINNLIKEKLAFNLKLTFNSRNYHFSSINFNFQLSEYGYKNPDLILKLLNKYIEMIRTNAFQKETLKILKENSILRFKQKESIKNSYQFIKKYIHNFQLNGKENFITSGEIFKDIDPIVLNDSLKNLTLHNSLIFLGARSFIDFNETYIYKVLNNLSQNSYFNDSTFLKEKDNFNKIQYGEKRLNNYLLLKLNDRKIESNLKLPEMNSILRVKDKFTYCKGLDIIECKKKYKIKNVFPNLFYKKNGVEIWYYQDKSHLHKSFHLNIKFQLNAFNLLNKSHVPLMKFVLIYFNYLWKKLIIKLKQSHLITLNFSDNQKKNMELFKWIKSKQSLKPENFLIEYRLYKFSGFCINIKSKSTESFLDSDITNLIKDILSRKIKKNEFIFLKEELIRNLDMFQSSNTTHQAFYWFFRLGFNYDIDYLSLTQYTKNITLDDFNKFKDMIFKEFTVKALGYGNIDQNKTEDFVFKIIRAFNNENKLIEYPIKSTQSFSIVNDHISKFPNYFYIFQKANLFKNNLCFTNLDAYFLGKNNYKNLLKMKILSNLAQNMIISYQSKENQHVNIIKHKIISIQDNLVFYNYIEGKGNTPKDIINHMNEIIKILKNKINNLDDKSLQEVKDIIYNKFKIKYSNYNRRHLMVWESIIKNEEIFNKDTIKRILQTLTKYKLKQFLGKIENHKISVQVLSSKDMKIKLDESDNIKQIENVNYFRSLKKNLNTKTLKSSKLIHGKGLKNKL